MKYARPPLFPCISCKTPRTARRAGLRCASCRASDQKAIADARDANRSTMRYDAHREQLAMLRDRLHGQCAYDVAVMHVESLHGQSRDTWEPIIGHPYVREANQLARKIAGIPEHKDPHRSHAV